MKKNFNNHYDEQFFEEEFYRNKKKDLKKYRKKLSKKDSSKQKKRNADKIQKDETNVPKEKLSKGMVIKILGESIYVSSHEDNKKIFSCKIKGKLKNKYSKDKNLLAIGDIVFFKILNEEEGNIEDIDERSSILSREDLVRKKKQIIAVNIDQVLITVSLLKPYLKPSLIDRYIISAINGNMTPIIVINKIDLLKNKGNIFQDEELKKEMQLYKELLFAYNQAGITTISVSSKTKKGLKNLKNIMIKKTSVFSGQSGTGKSSIINTLFNLDLKTSEVVNKTYKGAHTTTTASLIPLKEGGFCIDTPGIKSFGIWDIKKEDLKNYYSEFSPFEKKCKYPNCLHINQDGCFVKKAAEGKLISKIRYDSYVSIFESLEEKKLKR